MKIYNFVRLKNKKFLSVKNYGSIIAAQQNEKLIIDGQEPNYNRLAYLMSRDGEIVTDEFMLIKNNVTIAKKKVIK